MKFKIFEFKTVTVYNCFRFIFYSTFYLNVFSHFHFFLWRAVDSVCVYVWFWFWLLFIANCRINENVFIFDFVFGEIKQILFTFMICTENTKNMSKSTTTKNTIDGDGRHDITVRRVLMLDSIPKWLYK